MWFKNFQQRSMPVTVNHYIDKYLQIIFHYKGQFDYRYPQHRNHLSVLFFLSISHNTTHKHLITNRQNKYFTSSLVAIRPQVMYSIFVY